MEQHIQNLGKLIGNLHSLEFSLRNALSHLKFKNEHSSENRSLWEFKLGEQVPINAITSYASLKVLINEYNKLIASYGQEFCVDYDIVDLRDILAHGRVFALMKAEPLSLIKFGREIDGFVTVTHIVEMTEEWFKLQINLVLKNIRRVGEGELQIPRVRGMFKTLYSNSNEPEIQEILEKIRKIEKDLDLK